MLTIHFFITVDFVSPQSLVEQMAFEDSVMINSEHCGDNLPVKPPVDSILATITTQRVNEPSDPEVTSSPPPRDEEIMAVPLTANEEKTEAPPSVGETFTSPPPSSGEAFVLPPAGGGETVMSTPPLTSEETITSPPPSSGETIASQSPSIVAKSIPTTSQYQRMWSWDDTTVTTAPAAGPFRRAVTCINRPPPHSQRQQPQRSFDVAVLRRGGSSYQSRSLRHRNHGGPLPPSE